MINKIKQIISKLTAKRNINVPNVTFDDNEICCSSPEGSIQKMPWNKLKAVIIETNDQGPWQEDVYFLLFSNNKEHGFGIPQCATGSQQLLERLMTLPGFDATAVITAMGCTSNKSFLCWEVPGWSGENWPGVILARNYKKN